MAILESAFPFTGSIGDLIAYRVRGSDKVIIRRKGGVSRDRIRHDPAYENTRKVNSEFSGRSAASKWIMRMMYPLKSVADYNVAGPLHALLRPVQTLDSKSALGMRHVSLSVQPDLLEGFSLNRRTTFESILRCPVICSLNREDRQSVVKIPALRPGINFHSPRLYPWFSIIAVLGVVPDVFHTPDGYAVHGGYDRFQPVSVDTGWLATVQETKGHELALSYSETPPDNNFSLLLTVGIRFGVAESNLRIGQVRYAGAARICRVA
jgi:hypothetical protein